MTCKQVQRTVEPRILRIIKFDIRNDGRLAPRRRGIHPYSFAVPGGFLLFRGNRIRLCITGHCSLSGRSVTLMVLSMAYLSCSAESRAISFAALSRRPSDTAKVETESGLENTRRL